MVPLLFLVKKVSIVALQLEHIAGTAVPLVR